MTGFVAYQLDVRALDDHLVSAVNVSIEGPLHQRWFDGDFDGIPDSSPSGLQADSRGDSYLTLAAGALIPSAPVEDNNASSSPLMDTANFDYGVGTFLRGVWGIPGTTQTSDARLAYIVIPADFDPRDLDIEVKVVTCAWDSKFYTQTLTAADFFVPEPSSLILSLLPAMLLSGRHGRKCPFFLHRA